METMFYRSVPPWHGLGVNVGEDAVDSATAIKAAGLDWRVQKAKINSVHLPNDEGSTGASFMVQDPDDLAWVVVRQGCELDAGIPKILGLVGAHYHPVQNAESFAFLDSLAGSGQLRYETAGSLFGGRRVWMLASLVGFESLAVGGHDEVKPYLLLANSHDGNSGLVCRLTSTRVVCSNTLNIALGEKGAGITLRHTATIKARMDAAAKLIHVGQTSLESWLERANLLYGARITEAEWNALVDLLIPAPPAGPLPTIVIGQREALTAAYHGAPGAMPGTAWGALQGVTAYATHAKITRGGEEGRLQSLWFRSGAELMAAAQAVLVDTVLRPGSLVARAAQVADRRGAQAAGLPPVGLPPGPGDDEDEGEE
jgi:phage/plasmid-like protein (TIGR03299 family)